MQTHGWFERKGYNEMATYSIHIIIDVCFARLSTIGPINIWYPSGIPKFHNLSHGQSVHRQSCVCTNARSACLTIIICADCSTIYGSWQNGNKFMHPLKLTIIGHQRKGTFYSDTFPLHACSPSQLPNYSSLYASIPSCSALAQSGQQPGGEVVWGPNIINSHCLHLIGDWYISVKAHLMRSHGGDLVSAHFTAERLSQTQYSVWL